MKTRLLFVMIMVPGLIYQSVASSNDDFPLSLRDSLQSNPVLAYDNVHDRFFTVWSDVRYRSKTDVDIYGRILDANGKVITDDIPISVAKGGQAKSAVTFDHINKRYLVVWADWRNAAHIDSDIYGQFVGHDGRLIGDNFAVSSRRISQKQPSVAFDPDKKRFLVAWKDDRENNLEKLFARFIDADGKLLGREFAVAKGEGKQDRPSLRYDYKRKRFLVVWRDIVDEKQYLNTTLEGKGIFSAFIKDKHHVATPGILIDTEEDACLPPSLYAASYSPEDDVFLVAWTTARDYQKLGLDVYAAIIRASDGKRIGDAFAVAVEKDYQEFPSVIYDRKQGRFLVAWYDLRRDQSALNMDIYARYITADGKMSEEFIMTDRGAPGIRRFPAIAYSDKSATALLIWEDSRKKTNKKNYQRIFARVLDGN